MIKPNHIDHSHFFVNRECYYFLLDSTQSLQLVKHNTTRRKKQFGDWNLSYIAGIAVYNHGKGP